jgi:hypothetical protein
MFWSTKVVKAQVYEDGRLLDLNDFSGWEMQNLVIEIRKHWTNQEGSLIAFGVGWYNNKRCFRHSIREIEIWCYKIDETGKRCELNFSKAQLASKLGKRFSIKPENTKYIWNNVEVEYVV